VCASHFPNPADTGLEARFAVLEGAVLSVLRQFTDDTAGDADPRNVRLSLTCSASSGAVVIELTMSQDGVEFLGLSL
jgi:hypothetical protein